ncbi:MAG: DegT/DnrJ/EryC1/StrS family aminotransferase [Nitrosopumilaceae archaeon]
MKQNHHKKTIKLFEPYVSKEEVNEVSKVINGKFWASGAGIRMVSKFESAFTKYIGCKHSIALNSGTAALHLALSILGVSKKEVLLPSMTFVSTAHAAIYNNAKPKFVDIDESTLCIDINDLEKKITKNTKVVIPVHFGGYSCDLAKLQKLKNDYNLHIVEDAAHSCGAKFNGKRIGSHSELVCFSFHPVKNLSMPTGGAIAMNSHMKDIESLNSSRWCGITDRKGSLYDVGDLGWNYYMNEISAAIGLVQLKRLDYMNRIRKQIARKYSKELNIENKMPFSNDCSYHLYWIRVKNREVFMKKMHVEGIETGIHYKPVHLMKYYSNSTKLENCEKIWKEVVSIPMHTNLSARDTEKVIVSVNRFAKS